MCCRTSNNFNFISDRRQVSFVMIIEFERINQLLSHFKSSENLWFSNNIRGDQGFFQAFSYNTVFVFHIDFVETASPFLTLKACKNQEGL